MKFHPLADMFPLMTGDEFNKLVKDIDENGQAQPIFTYQGQIIDGRNRYKACEKLNLVPASIEFEGDEEELVPFIISLNLHRRHLSESQRAAVAGKLANLQVGRPQEDNSANLHNISQAKAAEMLNVSRRSVVDASTVRQHGTPELVQAVEQGEVAVSTAATIAKTLPKEIQNDVLKQAADIGAKVTNKLVQSKARTIREIEEHDRNGGCIPESAKITEASREIVHGVKVVPEDALWLWGRLKDFEREGMLNKDAHSLFGSMSDSMREDIGRILPKVLNWLSLLAKEV